jgi:hypothetical protein
MSRPGALAGALIALALVGAACSGGDRPEFTGDPIPGATSAADSTTTPPSTVPPSTVPATTTAPPVPAAPDGRRYPTVPDTLEAAAARLDEVETELRSIDPTDPGWADLAHEEQMLYRTIGRRPAWIPDVVAAVAPEHRQTVTLHLAARRAIAGIGHGGSGGPPTNVPAWAILEPLPLDRLEELYRSAEAETGIDWTFLAAINFIETGFGRIDGLSTAGAQGPMQFLPTTWEEVSDGDIHDPADAIPAAARYLVRRGGPGDMHRALRGYNNSDSYVAAVTHYANLFRSDPVALAATHAWEIHYSAADGDLWFPVGYREDEPVPVDVYLARAPWSAPPP